jgi:hypothetical protein
VRNSSDTVTFIEDVVVIEKTDPGNNRRGLYGKWSGMVRPVLEWKTSKTDNG